MIGILLINLGTPEAPTEEAVRKYLDVFLSDPYVITLPKFLRDFLVQKIILPKRPKSSAHAYQQVWTENGSPLLTNSLDLQHALSKTLGNDFCVALGMRYSKPSIPDALTTLHEKGCDKIMVLPLFPQFANATTQSALDVVSDTIHDKKIKSEIAVIRDFHDADCYTQTSAALIADALKKNPSDFLLFSYHGLPARQQGADDYRRQCHITTQLITNALSHPAEKYLTAFQSRLGFTKWIQPYTDKSLQLLRKNGVKKLSVVSPSFVADCVETLEEINIRLRAQWFELGGEDFYYIPCLNADERWVNALSLWIKNESLKRAWSGA